MGTEFSKPLDQWTPQDIAAEVEQSGPTYHPYAEAIVAEGVCGLILSSIEELEETLDDLLVESKIHRRVLAKKWSTFSGLSLEREGGGDFDDDEVGVDFEAPPGQRPMPSLFAKGSKRSREHGVDPSMDDQKKRVRRVDPARTNRRGLSLAAQKELALDIETTGGGLGQVKTELTKFCNFHCSLSDAKLELYGNGKRNRVRYRVENKIRSWARLDLLEWQATLLNLQVPPHPNTLASFQEVSMKSACAV